MAKTEFTLGSLRAYERNDDMADWVIRDPNNHLVAGGIPKELALLFAKAPEMYELLGKLLEGNGVCVHNQNPTEFPHTCYEPLICEEARQLLKLYEEEKP